jgi:hypothetical protein
MVDLILEGVTMLQAQYSDEVEYIEKDSLLRVQTDSIQTDAPWGLERIIQRVSWACIRWEPSSQLSLQVDLATDSNSSSLD